MSTARHGANTITIGGKEYLLAGRDKTHLVAEASDAAAGRPAISSWRFERDEWWQDAYDTARLQEPRWGRKTLCGRKWQEMHPGDGPSPVTWSTPAHAPNCRSCLRIATRDLATRPPDERIPLVTALAVQEVVEMSFTRIDGVPGDQAESLRTAIRKELRRRGLQGSTHLLGNTVFVVSDDAWQALPQSERDALDRQAADVIGATLAGDDPLPPRHRLHWDTWRVPLESEDPIVPYLLEKLGRDGATRLHGRKPLGMRLVSPRKGVLYRHPALEVS